MLSRLMKPSIAQPPDDLCWTKNSEKNEARGCETASYTDLNDIPGGSEELSLAETPIQL